MKTVVRYSWIVALYAVVSQEQRRGGLFLVQAQRMLGDREMMAATVGILEAFPLSPPLSTLPTVDLTAANNSNHVNEEDRGFSIQDTMTNPDGALQIDYVRGITSFNGMRTFEGISSPEVKNATGLTTAPPDPCIAVGKDQVVQMVNYAYQVYSKTGQGLLSTPMALSQIWTGVNECDTLDGDPIVLYDQHTNRWLLLKLAFITVASSPYYLCFAVSETEDATGSFYRFRYETGNSFPDYPKAGIWRDKLVVTTVTGMKSVSVYALNWNQMLDGIEANVVAFTLLRRDHGATIGWGLLPADVDGNNQPNKDAPIPLVGTQDDDHYGFGATSDGLSIWELSVDWENPNDATLAFISMLETAPFDTVFSCSPSSLDCISQKDTSQKLDQDPILQRPLYRLAYRRFGATQTSPSPTTVPGLSSEPSLAPVPASPTAVPGTSSEPSPAPVPEPEPGPLFDSWWCRLRIQSTLCRREQMQIPVAAPTETIEETVDEYESFVTNVIVQARPGIAAPRWFEIRRDTSGSYAIHQQGTFSPDDGINRFFASIAQDKYGNMAMGYSVVGVDVYAGIRVTGRSAYAPVLGEMNLGEDIIVNGGGSQTGSNRWGDYSAMVIDPTNDCTFYYVNEYYNTTSSKGWQTKIAAFQLENCNDDSN